MPVVSLRKAKPDAKDLKETVRRCMLEAGFEDCVEKNRPFLLKLNVVYDRLIPGVTTSALFLDAVLDVVEPFASETLVCDANDSVHTADKGFRKTGLEKLCRTRGVELVNLSDGPRRSIKVESPHFTEITVPEIVAKTPNRLSIPVMKTHNIDVFSGALKNIFGYFEDDRVLHHLNLGEAIALVNQHAPSTFSVMDAICALDGDGPITGWPVGLGLVLSSSDPVALDTVCAQVMGFDPKQRPTLKACAERGVGSMADIRVVGEKVEDVSRRFKVSQPPRYLHVAHHFLKYPVLQRVAFGFPVFNLCRLFVQLYKNVGWYNLRGRPQLRRFLEEDPYGRLLKPYLEGVDYEAGIFELY